MIVGVKGTVVHLPMLHSDGHTTAVEAAVDGLGYNTSASGGAETVW